MEISGAVVIRRSPMVPGAGIRREAADPSLFSGRAVYGGGRRLRVAGRRLGGGGGGFSDDGHLKYYVSPARCRETKKEEKKRAKLLKGLTKDLAALHSMGLGVETEEVVAGEVKSKMISEAAELLLTQLNQMRAQEKEMKKKRKDEKKAAMKSAKMKDCAAAADDSSCSSSESSDSECEDTVRVNTCRTAAAAIIPHPQSEVKVVPTGNSLCNALRTPLEEKPITSALECCGESNVVPGKPVDSKIEVCMGGKCKRSGALELMMEFERKVGVEGAVVGCKCMGKCKDGPNVRVLNHNAGEGSLEVSKNPLCIGVGLGDVGAIVANFFGEQDAGLMTA